MIHSSIASTSTIGNDVSIGRFCVIGENVVVGRGSRIGNHVILHDGTRLGEAVREDDNAARAVRRGQGPWQANLADPHGHFTPRYLL